MASGSQITSADLSSLRDKMNTILNGTGVLGGYNQSHTVAANPSAGDQIDDAYLDSIYSAAAKISNFYNITNTFTAVDAGTTVAWTHYGSVAGAFNTDITARFDAPWSYATGWDTSVVQETTETASNWNGSRVQIVRASFGNMTTMNAWMAAGGEIRVSASHSASGSENQGTSWAQLAGEMGTYKISAKASETNVDTSTNYKYSDLTGSYVVIKKEFADDSDYSTNYIQVEAYLDGGDLYVKTTLNDAHTARSGSGSGYGGAWSWSGYDTVPGTSTVTFNSLKMSNPAGSVSITNPTFTVTDSL
jgi:hypothetical protein|tara:strand:- start:3851 stop:4762 length:912 start_codon:yes stop_codon:yes gene_type:complete